MLIKNYQSPSDEGLVNLTPLIDVVFVVLISFILIAPLIELDRVELAPKKSAAIKKESFEKSAINIYVYEDNSIWIDKQKVSTDELLKKLKILQNHHPDVIPRLFHDKKAYFGTYQTIKETIEAAGFEQLDVILKAE